MTKTSGSEKRLIEPSKHTRRESKQTRNNSPPDEESSEGKVLYAPNKMIKKLCCSWRATIRAWCDAIPFDRQSNAPMRQRRTSQSTCRGARVPWATSGGTVESSASSVFGLRECVLVAASHGVET
jgi:hypothetical protein